MYYGAFDSEHWTIDADEDKYEKIYDKSTFTCSMFTVLISIDKKIKYFFANNFIRLSLRISNGCILKCVHNVWKEYGEANYDHTNG